MNQRKNPPERQEENRSPGAKWHAAMQTEQPLQIAGAINACTALMAEQAGFKALYLSGAGVANASHGLPDLGLTTLSDVLADSNRITSATSLPLLVDADTGWGQAFMIQRTVSEMIKAGVAGIHIEDQVAAKRCGHRPGKALVSTGEMADRLRAAVDAKSNPDFILMARTDAATVEGLDAAIDRACRYREAGADMIFAEALTDLDHYRRFVDAVQLPVLANITEFGKTPLFTRDQLKSVGVSMVLYPLSAFRAMNAAAREVYETIRQTGTQQSLVDRMQSREELYQVLNYYAYECKLDELFSKHGKPEQSKPSSD